MNTLTRVFSTPVGDMEIGLTQYSDVGKEDVKFQYFAYANQPEFTGSNTPKQHELLDLAERQLTEYFNQQRTDFSDLMPFIEFKGTAFQQTVWAELKNIPFGETWSYGQLAKNINNPKAVRAVGAANSKNPFSIVVPCHRVIGANGTLTGYAGGVDKKQWLLNLERHYS